MTLNVGTVLNNRYRIVKLVGQGGFGAVYRAWDTNLMTPVALKENADTGPDAQRQFEREAHLLANLRHANLPRVSDHFVLPGQGQYLVDVYKRQLIRVALVMALRAYLYNDTFFDQTWALGFLGGVVVAGLLVWLLARLVPRAWLARLPHGNRLR